MQQPRVSTPLPLALERRVTYLLHCVADSAGRKATARLAPLGFDTRHYGVLAVLESAAAPSQRAFADELGIDRATLVALIDDLVGLGLVRREQSAQDRRANTLHLTGDGEAALREAHALMDACEREFMQVLSGEDRQRIAAMLARLSAGNA